MAGKKTILFILLLALCTKTFSAVFVVTSNADSGPATFRDALMQAAANGNAQTDFITFNLPDISTAGRTVAILSTLPEITSNLVIDGSTQPGAPYGISSAKICLTFDSKGQGGFAALTAKNRSNISIYGLYIRLLNIFPSGGTKPIGIHITGTNNVQLGDAGKGNVMAAFITLFL